MNILSHTVVVTVMLFSFFGLQSFFLKGISERSKQSSFARFNAQSVLNYLQEHCQKHATKNEKGETSFLAVLLLFLLFLGGHYRLLLLENEYQKLHHIIHTEKKMISHEVHSHFQSGTSKTSNISSAEGTRRGHVCFNSLPLFLPPFNQLVSLRVSAFSQQVGPRC